MKIKVTKRKVDIVLEAEKNGKTVRKESYEPSEARTIVLERIIMDEPTSELVDYAIRRFGFTEMEITKK